MAIQAMDGVRRQKMSTQHQAVKVALDNNDRKMLKSLTLCIRRNPQGWSVKQTNAMHWLRHSTLKRARAGPLKLSLCEVYAKTSQENSSEQAKADLLGWISWAKRSRLYTFKKLAVNLKQRIDGLCVA